MLQHDNALCHIAPIIKMGLKNGNVQMMMWPTNNLDLNQIGTFCLPENQKRIQEKIKTPN